MCWLGMEVGYFAAVMVTIALRFEISLENGKRRGLSLMNVGIDQSRSTYLRQNLAMVLNRSLSGTIVGPYV